MADEPEELEEEEAADDDSSIFDGEAFFVEGRAETCRQLGLLGLTMRDGFLYGLKVREGEVLFHELLKKHGQGAVKPIK
jgi:hypothetical protein